MGHLENGRLTFDDVNTFVNRVMVLMQTYANNFYYVKWNGECKKVD